MEANRADSRKLNHQKEKQMFMQKLMLRAAGGGLAAVIVLAAHPLGAQQTSSESDRLQKLERAVEQLQKRNAELEDEVRSLKKQTAFDLFLRAK